MAPTSTATHAGETPDDDLTTDQRGFGRVVGGTVDIGAVESGYDRPEFTGGTTDPAAPATIVGTSDAGTQPIDPGYGQPGGYEPSSSYDGRYVVFTSTSQTIEPGNANGGGRADVFLKDTLTGETFRMTAGDDSSSSPTVSDDGRYVAFVSSATDLVAGDTNATADVFVYDRVSGVTERISVATGGGQSDGFSYLPQISATPATSRSPAWRPISSPATPTAGWTSSSTTERPA